MEQKYTKVGSHRRLIFYLHNIRNENIARLCHFPEFFLCAPLIWRSKLEKSEGTVILVCAILGLLLSIYVTILLIPDDLVYIAILFLR